MKFNLRLLYLYLFSFVGLLITVIGGIRIVDLGIKSYIFPEADTYEIYPMSKIEGEPTQTREELVAQQKRDTTRNRQRELSGSASMIIVGLPLYLYHWNTIKKEKV